MEDGFTLEIIAIFILILANGFFSLSEFSIIASRKSRLKQFIAENRKGAQHALNLNDNPDKFLATVQVGITLVATLAGVFGGATIVHGINSLVKQIPIKMISNASVPISVGILTILITITTVVIGELVPKYLALSNPERYARRVARPIELFIKLTGFFSSALSKTSNFILKMFGIKTDGVGTEITEDEINHIIFEGKQSGLFDDIEEKLVKSVFDFADSNVRRALTPRTDVVGFDINASSQEVIDSIIENGYSRYPVYEKTIDNVVGILNTKDIIAHKIDPNLIIVKDMLRSPIFVPDSMPLSTLLNSFQKQKQHIAIVLDEFGGTAGIITLEDILEELVGEIQDEYDTEPMPIVKHSETVSYVGGQVWPGDVNDEIGSNFPEDDADTMAGLIIDHLGEVPEKNQKIEYNNYIITILEKIDNRITRLKLEKFVEDESRFND